MKVMKLRGITLLCLIIGSGSCYAQKAAVVLSNRHLEVAFATNKDGPYLSSVKYKPSGEVYRFTSSDEASLALVSTDQIHNPKTVVGYPTSHAGTIKFVGENVSADNSEVAFKYRHPLTDVEVTYSLMPDEASVRKVIACTGGGKGAYIAGVRLWNVGVANGTAEWPDDREKQTIMLFQPKSGCLFTYEVPRARVAVDNNIISLEYRPGHKIKPNETRTVAIGSIVFFDEMKYAADTRVEVARRAFFDHLAKRTKPIIPAPLKFTTWGPWLQDGRADRVLQVMDDLARIGTDLVHIDAGWMWPLNPLSSRFDHVRNATDGAWDKAMTEPSRFPDGMIPLVEVAAENGMALSIHIDVLSSRWAREVPSTAFITKGGKPLVINEQPSKRVWVASSELREELWDTTVPIQSLSSRYGDLLKDFSLQAISRYDLGGIMYDFHRYNADFSTERDVLANGWEGVDPQYRIMTEIFDAIEDEAPGIYKFYCKASSLPWMLKHATHIHAVDPGTSKDMARAVRTDHPSRALAYERRLAWQRHYNNFVPPWGIKGDIAGWAMQQGSPIPINLDHTGLLIPSGEGWTQNMFTCFATTSVRDIRFSFAQMPEYDKAILDEWLQWDRRHSRAVLNCRPLLEPSEDPDRGIMAYSHVKDGTGIMYLFNADFELGTISIKADELSGFRPGDIDRPAYLVYPVKAPLGDGMISYGDVLEVPIIGKDCVVIEIGHMIPAKPKLIEYRAYEELAASVKRSFKPIFITSLEELGSSLKGRSIILEAGDSPRDKRLAAQLLDTLGAKLGTRISGKIDNSAQAEEAVRLIIGTSEGLSEHSDIGHIFERTMYNQYIRWGNRLISAPMVGRLQDQDAFCLIAPRPEQLAQLDNALSSDFASGRTSIKVERRDRIEQHVTLECSVPSGDPILRFMPKMERTSMKPLPPDVGLIKFYILAETDDFTRIIWSEDIPPFLGVGVGKQWWNDRIISVSEYSGKDVKFHFIAELEDSERIDMAYGFDGATILH